MTRLLCFFVSIIDFQFVVTMRIWYSRLYLYKIVLNYWSFNFQSIYYSLHLYSCLLMIIGFGIIFLCWWFPTFTVYLPLLASLPICNFFVFYLCLFLFCLEKYFLLQFSEKFTRRWYDEFHTCWNSHSFEIRVCRLLASVIISSGLSRSVLSLCFICAPPAAFHPFWRNFQISHFHL